MSTTAAIATRVRGLRKARGWSAQRLAEEMTAAGLPWDRNIVANLENGRRKVVTVDELLCFARIFDVGPMALLDENAHEEGRLGRIENGLSLLLKAHGLTP